MAEVDDLLAAAKAASRQDRIAWRDPIAALGARAIPAMRQWLSDSEYGAFATRVLARIAESPADRLAVIDALASVDLAAVSEPVARDVADTLDRLRPRQSSRTAQTHWSGYAAASPLERRFHEAMLDIFTSAGEATRKKRPDGTVERGYWASYFLQGVRNHGGLAYARQLLEAAGTSDGFARLSEEGRLDLTMEALVLQPEFSGLFTPGERQVAASRLARAGYEPLLGDR